MIKEFEVDSKIVRLSAEDAELLAKEFPKSTMGLHYNKSNVPYPTITKQEKGERKIFVIARWLMGLTDSKLQLAYADSDTCNLDRPNLIVGTSTQVRAGRGKKKASESTSKYLGVVLAAGKWRAMIKPSAKEKNIHLGYFDEEVVAAKAYDRAARKFHREFAKLNFPDGHTIITVYRDKRCSMAKVTWDGEDIMEGNYWDFHPECHDIQEYGRWNGAGDLARAIMQRAKALGMKPELVEKTYTYTY